MTSGDDPAEGAAAEAALRWKAYFETTLQSMAQGICVFDGEQRLVGCNDRYAELFGLTPELTRPGVTLAEILRRRVEVGQYAGSDPETYIAERLRVARSRQSVAEDLMMADGRTIALVTRHLPQGGLVSTFEDVTDRRRVEAELAAQNRRFDSALSNMAQGLMMLDADLRLIVCNSRYRDLFGLAPEVTQPGAHLSELIALTGARGSHASMTIEQVMAERRALFSRGERASTQFVVGDGRIIEAVYNPMQGGGWVATYADITARHLAETRLAHMARHDALTDLPNRTLFRERLLQVLAEAAGAEPVPTTAVLCLDLDRFKAVNDTLGHSTGDALLREVTARLSATTRGSPAMVARLGGDEFALLLAHATPERASELARRLIEEIGRGYEIGGQRVDVGLSVGISLAPMDGEDPDQLLRAADMALYRVKGEGRGAFHFFEIGMDARMQARRALELDLRQALAEGQFELHYQPLVTLDTDRISGFEALLRWRHPVRGLVAPAEFIPLSEEIGLIVPLGEWVLREACREAANWPSDVRVAVNLSPVQFRGPALVLTVAAALGAAGLDPTRLELEITEGVLLQESATTLAILHQLKTLGVRIVMDDFGTGYSSLSYLRTFPFDKIKIDRSFITDIATRPDAGAIVRAVTSLGASLSITTTAEGIETPEQLARLRSENCTEVQGFLISRPAPASELAALLARYADRIRDGIERAA